MVANFFVPLFLVDHFGLQETQIGTLSAIVNASSALFGPLIGMAGDKWGHTKVLVIPVTAIFSFYGTLVLCPNIVFLPMIYVLNGLTGASSLISAIISNHVTKAQQPNAFAVFSIAGRIFTPISPIIGGLGYSQSPALPLLIVSLFLPLPLSLVGVLHFVQRNTKYPD
jgi:MFS family permease